MAEIKISSLPQATLLDGTEEVPLVQGGTTKRAASSLLGSGSTSAGAINTQTSTNYTLVLTDGAKRIHMGSSIANTLTFPSSASVDFPINTPIHITNISTGVTTLTAGAGVTLNSRAGSTGLVSPGQYAQATVYKSTIANTWYAGAFL